MQPRRRPQGEPTTPSSSAEDTLMRSPHESSTGFQRQSSPSSEGPPVTPSQLPPASTWAGTRPIQSPVSAGPVSAGTERDFPGPPSGGIRGIQQQQQIWSPDVEFAFRQALALIPPMGRRKVVFQGKPCGRNELISQHILKLTNKFRTRKQVSSHLQVLKKTIDKSQSTPPLLPPPSEPGTQATPPEMIFTRSYIYAGVKKGFALDPEGTWGASSRNHCLCFWDVYTGTEGGMGAGLSTSTSVIEATREGLVNQETVPKLRSYLQLSLPNFETSGVTSLAEVQTIQRERIRCVTNVYSFDKLIHQTSETREGQWTSTMRRFCYHFEFVQDWWEEVLTAPEGIEMYKIRQTFYQVSRSGRDERPVLAIEHHLGRGPGDMVVFPNFVDDGDQFPPAIVKMKLKPLAAASTIGPWG